MVLHVMLQCTLGGSLRVAAALAPAHPSRCVLAPYLSLTGDSPRAFAQLLEHPSTLLAFPAALLNRLLYDTYPSSYACISLLKCWFFSLPSNQKAP